MQRDTTIPNTDQSLPSRLDHVDIIMNRLEGKRNTSMPVGFVGGNDDSNKGTLLDRVTALENRLCQLCLDIESSTTSAFSNSGYTSSCHESKSEPSSSSFPDHIEKKSRIQMKEPEIQEQLDHNEEANVVREVAENYASRNEVTKSATIATGKKKSYLKWPTLRKLLGC